MIARNKCCKCKHKWRDQPGALGGGCCPKCGCIYFKWSSFEFDKKKYGREFDFGNY